MHLASARFGDDLPAGDVVLSSDILYDADWWFC